MGQYLLPLLFGEVPVGHGDDPLQLPFEILERLIVVAFRTISVDQDTVRPSGVVYSPDDRDRAQDARSNAFSRFAGTPGRATFIALNRWAELKDFPVEPRRLRELAFARAAQDAEHAPWLPSEAYALEQHFDLAPTTPRICERSPLAASLTSNTSRCTATSRKVGSSRTFKTRRRFRSGWRTKCATGRGAPIQWSANLMWSTRRSPTFAFAPRRQTPAYLSR